MEARLETRVCSSGPPFFAIRIDGRGHGVKAIGIGGPDDRAAVVVAESECIGDGIVIGKIAAVVVAHRQHRVVSVDWQARGDKAVHGAAVPALVLGNPVVGNVVGAGGVGLGGIEMEGKEHARRRTGWVSGIGLIESRARV